MSILVALTDRQIEELLRAADDRLALLREHPTAYRPQIDTLQRAYDRLNAAPLTFRIARRS